MRPPDPLDPDPEEEFEQQCIKADEQYKRNKEENYGTETSLETVH